MTPADKLKELREALEGATPGPWKVWPEYGISPEPGVSLSLDDDGPNVRAIVALMNAAPALLAIAEAAAFLVKSSQNEDAVHTPWGDVNLALGRLLDHS